MTRAIVARAPTRLDFGGGWTIEMRIPFRSIRFKEAGDVWGVNFRRDISRNNESAWLVFTPKNGSVAEPGLVGVAPGSGVIM